MIIKNGVLHELWVYIREQSQKLPYNSYNISQILVKHQLQQNDKY